MDNRCRLRRAYATQVADGVVILDYVQEIVSNTQMPYLSETLENHLSNNNLFPNAYKMSLYLEIPDEEPYIGRLRQILMRKNKDKTKVISLSPLQERGEDELPIELLFAQVVIREDPKYREKGRHYSHYQKEVTDPNDIFMRNRERVRTVYMLGDAAHGKTTYCLWLVQKWYNAQHGDLKGSNNLDKWEKALTEFDFIFLLQFRNVSPDLASVVDMICQDVFADDEDCWDTIRYVLSSNKYRSLIIMDGLDEWNPNEEAKKQLKCQRIPNLHMSSTVSCFFTMRPWVFSMISKLVKITDRILEIHGLSETGMEKVVKNVLLCHYRLKYDSPRYHDKCRNIVRNLKRQSIRSFMHIPLLAVVCVQICYEGKQVLDSMTYFYTEMLNMLIERAFEKHEIISLQDKTVDFEVPQFFSEHENIKNNISVLLKLGKIAYDGLVSNETNLVFQKAKLEKEVGLRELQFALDVGLISQKEAHSLTTKNVSVHFFHKSIQEFLAVIYIVTNKEVGDSFCKHLSNVKVIMELSNVIMFICGMCPSLGSVISQRVVSVTDSDTEICEFRESPDDNSTVRELYKLQTIWYRELQYGRTDNPEAFYVSDIYLDDESDTETVRVTRELMSDTHVVILSLMLHRVTTDGTSGIPNTELNAFLINQHHKGSLVMVFIDAQGTDRYIGTLCIPSLRTLYLGYVRIDQNSPKSHLLTKIRFLNSLWLVGVYVGDRSVLHLSSDRVTIEKLMLVNSHMTTAEWRMFIWSIISCHLVLDVQIVSNNNDDQPERLIESIPSYVISQFEEDRYINSIEGTKEEEEEEEEICQLQEGQSSEIPLMNACTESEYKHPNCSGFVKPLFLSEREVLESEPQTPSQRISRQEIFLAMRDFISADHIRGIQHTGKFWRVYVENIDDRNTLLTSGINVRGKHVSLIPENPRKKRRRRDTTTTLKVFDVPLSVDDQRIKGSIEREGCVVLDLYREKLKVKAREENVPSISTNCDTGTRIVIVRKLKFHLPRILSVGKHTASIWYDGQPNYEGALSRHSYEIENDSDSDESNMTARQTKGFLSLCCCFSRNDDDNSDENAGPYDIMTI